MNWTIGKSIYAVSKKLNFNWLVSSSKPDRLNWRLAKNKALLFLQDILSTNLRCHEKQRMNGAISLSIIVALVLFMDGPISGISIFMIRFDTCMIECVVISSNSN